MWYQLQELLQIDLGPAPPHEVEVLVIEYEAFKRLWNCGAVWAQNTREDLCCLFGLNIDIVAELNGKGKKPLSLIRLEPCFKEED